MTQLVRFSHSGAERLGVVNDDHYIDVTRASAERSRAAGEADPDQLAARVLPPDALAYFDGGGTTYRALTDAVAYALSLDRGDALRRGVLFSAAECEILVPIPNPRKIVCLARNFGKHAVEAGLELSPIPILFARFAATQLAHGKPIEVPRVSNQLDWEGELAVVIGRKGRHVSVESAMDYVAGYTIFNDVTVRDYQFRVTQYTAGKNFATSGPVGPTITLTDEGFDPHDAAITTRVNGVVKQHGSTTEFVFDIPTIINEISTFIDIEPGDIIPMGTPAGVGFKRSPPEFLCPGDVVEVEVPGLGVLRNPVISEEDSHV